MPAHTMMMITPVLTRARSRRICLFILSSMLNRFAISYNLIPE